MLSPNLDVTFLSFSKNGCGFGFLRDHFIYVTFHKLKIKAFFFLVYMIKLFYTCHDS